MQAFGIVRMEYALKIGIGDYRGKHGVVAAVEINCCEPLNSNSTCRPLPKRPRAKPVKYPESTIRPNPSIETSPFTHASRVKSVLVTLNVFATLT